MKRSWMAGWGRVAVVVAALALVMCDLSSPQGLAPAQAGFFSKAKSGGSDKDEKSKGGSTSTASKDKGKSGSGGGLFSGAKGNPGSPGGPSGVSTGPTQPRGAFGGLKGSATTDRHGTQAGNATAPQSGIFSRTTRSDGRDDNRQPAVVRPGGSPGTPSSPGGLFGRVGGGNNQPVVRTGGSPGTPSSPGGLFGRVGGGGNQPVVRTGGSPGTPSSSSGLFGRVGGGRDQPVWRPGGSSGTPGTTRNSGGFYGGNRGSRVERHTGQGYFSEVARLKAASHHRYVDRHPRTVDWWWWWYPYDLRYYQWHYGYCNPFAPDYAFIFLYGGGFGVGYGAPYYIYRPVVVQPAVIVISPWADSGGGYPYLSQVEGSLGEAVRDIEQGWRNENADQLMRHVDGEREIRVYYGNTFSHTMTASEFADLTRDAFSTTRTVSMRFDSVVRISDDWAKAKGRHTFYDPNGDERTVYVYYSLERQRDGGSTEWLIREIGQGPDPY